MKRILIITGASSGLGREFAFQIPKERSADEIWLLARRKDKLESLALELAARGGTAEPGAAAPKARVVEIDLGGRKGIAAFSAILEKEHRANVDGGIVIDTLVNNAGFGTYGTFTATGLERQLDMIDLNVLTLTGLCHASLPYMTKGSLIINVASLASFIPLGNFAVYAATKAYVLSFSTALAAEVEDDGVFVSTVCPGPVDTEFANIASRGAREKVVDGRNPADVVAHCLRQIRRKKHSAIMAPKWKFKAFMSRFVGRYFFARHAYIHDKRPSK